MYSLVTIFNVILEAYLKNIYETNLGMESCTYFFMVFVKDYTAKLSDFGLAKCGSKVDKTYMSTVTMGTHGYADPEYVMTGMVVG